MLMLNYNKSNNTSNGQSISGKIVTSNDNNFNNDSTCVNINKIIDSSSFEKQSKLDDELDKDPGLIPRKKGPLCKHSDKGMCEYCSPLPPWDKEYQADHNIKHISFHAYIDELNSKVNKKEGGSSYIPPLKPSNFSINKNVRQDMNHGQKVFVLNVNHLQLHYKDKNFVWLIMLNLKIVIWLINL